MVDSESSVGVASAGNGVIGEAARARAEPPVWAYCRELCGPVACKQAATATLRALGTGSRSGDGLLRLTRATAASHVSARMNGSGGLSPTCSTTMERLVAGAEDQLAQRELRDLVAHLRGCLVCMATGIKMDRAERVFAVMQAGMGTLQPRPAPVEPAVASRAAPAPAPAGAGLGNAALDAPRARAAVRAYCRELCGAAASERAVEVSLAAHRDGNGSAPAGAAELLRTTRLIAATHASRYLSPSQVGPKCAETPTRLAARANDELGRRQQRELEEHLRHCLACQAAEIKLARAERAFATIAAVDPVLGARLGAIAPAPDPTQAGLGTVAPPSAQAGLGTVAPPSAQAGLGTVAPPSAPAPPRPDPSRPRADPSSPRPDPSPPRADPSSPRPDPSPPRPEFTAPRSNPVPPRPRPFQRRTAAAATAAAAAASTAAAATASADTHAGTSPAPAPPPPARPEPTLAPPAPPRPARPEPALAPPAPPRPARPEPTLTPPAPAEAPPAGEVRVEHRRGRLVGVVIAAALMIVAVIPAVLVAGGGSSKPSASHPRAAATTPAPPAAATATTTHPAVKPAVKPKPVVHRAPARAKVKPARKPAHRAAKPASTPTVVASAPATPRATPTPTPTPTPTAPKHVAATPPTSQASSPPPAPKPSAPAVTPQGSSLPAQSAPTQGITPSGH